MDLKLTALAFRPDRRSCVPCPDPSYIVNIDGSCEKCQEGSFPSAERTFCSPCQADEVNLDGVCLRCPDGLIPSDNKEKCIRCSPNLIANEGLCKTCPNPETE